MEDSRVRAKSINDIDRQMSRISRLAASGRDQGAAQRRLQRAYRTGYRYIDNIRNSDSKYISGSDYNAGDPYNHRYDNEKVSSSVYLGNSNG